MLLMKYLGFDDLDLSFEANPIHFEVKLTNQLFVSLSTH